MSTTTHSAPSSARRPWWAFLGRSGFGIAVAVLLFTALIWLRLRLVTDVPRQAYAVPERSAPAQVDQAGRVDGAREP